MKKLHEFLRTVLVLAVGMVCFSVFGSAQAAGEHDSVHFAFFKNRNVNVLGIANLTIADPELVPSDPNQKIEGSNSDVTSGADDASPTSQKDQTEQRLKLAGLIGVGVISLLFVLFAFLRVDHATRGVYTRRLQSFSLIVVICIILIICFVYQKLL